MTSSDEEKIKEIVVKKVLEKEKESEELRQAQLKAAQAAAAANVSNQNGTTTQKSTEWCDEEIKLLVKGAQLFPIGTRNRFKQN